MVAALLSETVSFDHASDHRDPHHLVDARNWDAVQTQGLLSATRLMALSELDTFVPYRRWLSDGWADEQLPGTRLRPASHRPVELTIADAVHDAMRFATATIPLAPGEILSLDRVFGDRTS